MSIENSDGLVSGVASTTASGTAVLGAATFFSGRTILTAIIGAIMAVIIVAVFVLKKKKTNKKKNK